MGLLSVSDVAQNVWHERSIVQEQQVIGSITLLWLLTSPGKLLARPHVFKPAPILAKSNTAASALPISTQHAMIHLIQAYKLAMMLVFEHLHHTPLAYVCSGLDPFPVP
jgi:hypothetical protein